MLIITNWSCLYPICVQVPFSKLWIYNTAAIFHQEICSNYTSYIHVQLSVVSPHSTNPRFHAWTQRDHVTAIFIHIPVCSHRYQWWLLVWPWLPVGFDLLWPTVLGVRCLQDKVCHLVWEAGLWSRGVGRGHWDVSPVLSFHGNRTKSPRWCILG